MTQIIIPPFRFPYLLWHVEGYYSDKYLLAATDEQAIRLSNIARAKALPVSVKATIKTLGHNATSKFVKNFGSCWICKDDMFFFRSLP